MASENEQVSLKQMIQGMIPDSMAVLQGTVKSANPLKIQMASDEKLLIGPNITYVPKHLTDYETSCTIEGGSASGTTTDGTISSFSYEGRITVHNALSHASHEACVSFNHGKQYYVLDRVN